MASGHFWFRMNANALAHPKIRGLTSDELRLLLYIWSLACLSSEPGVVRLTQNMGLTPQQLADGAGLPLEADPDECLVTLVTRGLVTRDEKGVIRVHDWHEHQTRRPSEEPDAVAARVRKHRAKRNAEVTTRNALPTFHVTPVEKSREEKKEEPMSSQPPAAPTGVVLPLLGEATPPAKQKASAEVQAVADHYVRVMGKGARWVLDKKRAKSVAARLAEGYTVADLCRAVDGCKASPHHMGQNDRGQVYDDLSLICRDAAHVDQFLGAVKPLPAKQPLRPDPVVRRPPDEEATRRMLDEADAKPAAPPPANLFRGVR